MACFSTNLKPILLHLMSALPAYLPSFFQVCHINLASTLLNAKMCYPPFYSSVHGKHCNASAVSFVLYRKDDERDCGEQLCIMDLALRIGMMLVTTCQTLNLWCCLDERMQMRDKEKIKASGWARGISQQQYSKRCQSACDASYTSLHCREPEMSPPHLQSFLKT